MRDRSNARVVAITGSTGKTSTKDILYAICAPQAKTIANEGNYNNELGVPLTLARLELDTEICITELGMRGLGQIAYLASFTKPDIGVITNVGPVHLELVETIENVAKAKAELLAALCRRAASPSIPDEPLLEPHLDRDGHHHRARRPRRAAAVRDELLGAAPAREHALRASPRRGTSGSRCRSASCTSSSRSSVRRSASCPAAACC